MDVRIGIVIAALLWLGTEQQYPKGPTCASITDLAEPCGCSVFPAKFDLICGSDGRTYLGRCFLACRETLANVKISVAHKGTCVEDSGCTCGADYNPVCATNGRTYANECVLTCFASDHRIQLQHNGPCRSYIEKLNFVEPKAADTKAGSCAGCDRDLTRLRTRFGNNGKSHNPPPKQLGTRKGLQDRCVCAVLHMPVCSTDNVTFVNFCVLHCAANRNPGVEFQYWGMCGTRNKSWED